jgi:hypothetical protein
LEKRAASPSVEARELEDQTHSTLHRERMLDGRMRTGVEHLFDRAGVMNLCLDGTGTTKNCRQPCRSVGGPARGRNDTAGTSRFFHDAVVGNAERTIKKIRSDPVIITLV